MKGHDTMKLNMREFLQTVNYLGQDPTVNYVDQNITVELYVEYYIDNVERLLVLSSSEIYKYGNFTKFWNYIYERTNHYINADTKVEYYHYIKDNNSNRIKIFVNGRRPIRRAVKDLYKLEESIKEHKEYGGDGLTEVDFYNEIARIAAELAISLDLVRPTTVDNFTDCLYEHLDKWRTAIFDEGDFK